MISFRYHLVSVIGLFLALALGVVIGTSAVNGAVVGDLRRQVKDLTASEKAAQASNQQLSAAAGNADLIAHGYGAKLAAGALANTSVVLVGAPGADSSVVDAEASEIKTAGGSVSATLQMSKDFLTSDRATDIRSLATSGVHPIGLQLPTDNDPGSLAGSLLGWVLLGHGQSTDLTQVLSAFNALNLVKATGGTPTPGKLVVLVGTGGGIDATTLASTTAFVRQLGADGAVVVAGNAASDGAGGMINAIRTDAATRAVVSTVDDADGALGQLTTVLTGKEVLGGHKAQYGTGPHADALMPGLSG